MSSISRAIKLANKRRLGTVLSVAGRKCYLDIGGVPAFASLASGVSPSVGDTVAVTDINGSLLVEVVTKSREMETITRTRPVSSREQDNISGSRIFVDAIAVAANSTYTLVHNFGVYPKSVVIWHNDGSGNYVKVHTEAAVQISQQTIEIVTGDYTVNNAIRQSTGGSYIVIAE